MILHKYISANFGIESILQSRLKVSIPSELNDPFEMIPRDSGLWTRRKMKKYLKNRQRQNRIYQDHKRQGIVKNKKGFKEALKDLDTLADTIVENFQSTDFRDYLYDVKARNDKTIRSISYSSELANCFDEILLWTHYASNHTGLRLDFDSDLLKLPFSELRKINYSPERAPVDFTLEGGDQFLNQLVNALITKSECWSYEKEFRLFIAFQQCYNMVIDGRSLVFVDFPIKSLVEVDIGLNCSKEHRRRLYDIIKQPAYAHIIVKECKLDKEKFQLNYF